MKSTRLNSSRFIVGMILIAAAVGSLLYLGDDYTVGAAGIGILGLLSIATSRKR